MCVILVLKNMSHRWKTRCNKSCSDYYCVFFILSKSIYRGTGNDDEKPTIRRYRYESIKIPMHVRVFFRQIISFHLAQALVRWNTRFVIHYRANSRTCVIVRSFRFRQNDTNKKADDKCIFLMPSSGRLTGFSLENFRFLSIISFA